MRHRVAGRKLGRHTNHRIAMWRNMAVSLFTHGQITTTVPKAKSPKPFVEQEIGVIPVDAIFSPVTRVRYKTEDTRVGQKTNFDKLTLEIWTNGTLTPEMALVEASPLLGLSSFTHEGQTAHKESGMAHQMWPFSKALQS